MSRRLLQRGRYPKGPSVDQITSSNSQFPPAAAVPHPSQPVMNCYDAPQQSQPEQNSWNQQPYPNPTSYQQTAPPAHEQTTYWSGAQMLPSTMQAPWNESWNCKPDNPTESSGFANYQQAPLPPAAQQWQQTQYASINNQSYSQPTPNNSNSQVQQGYQYQSANNSADHQAVNSNIDYQTSNNTVDMLSINNTDYQPANSAGPYSANEAASYHYANTSTNYQTANNTVGYTTSNNSSNMMSSNATLPNWENGSLSVTQPEELPWTYSAPQYCNPPATEFSQNANPSVSTSWHPSVSSSQVINSQYNSQNALPPNYLPVDNSKSNCGTSELHNPLQHLEQKDLESSDLNYTVGASVSTNEVCDIDYESSTLSAFFHPSDMVKPDYEQPDQGEEVITKNLELSSQEIRTSPTPVVESSSTGHTSGAVSEAGSTEGTHSDFVQEESMDDLDVDDGSFSRSASPCLVEEPVNQEVLEPHISDLLNLPLQPNKENDESGGEPLNQQVPTKSGQSSRSTSAERERLVIRPREDSPFKPPRTNAKSIVVQQEVTEVNLPEEKPLEEKTVVQEVNLETFPDNLERPSDYEELRKQSPLYASHKKHLRQELNSSPSSLLCDNPDIPCVTLAPAAPPISSAKSDKSESSNDSRSERLSAHSSNPSLYRLQESVPNTVSSNTPKQDLYEKSKKSRQSPLASNVTTKSEKHLNKSSSPHSKNYSIQKKLIKNEMCNVENFEPQVPLLLKDSKVNGKAPNNERLPESFQKPISAELEGTSSMTNSPRREESSYPSRQPDPRYDHRNDSRQRFSEQQYYSYDERQYYSDRESSRPSSRSSLRDHQGEYPYQPSHDDYPYQSTRNDPRHHQEYPRSSSRMSETDARSDEKSVNRSFYRQPYQYPQGPNQYPQAPNQYPQAPNQFPRDPRDPSYYQRSNRKGYEYDPYQRDMYYASYYDAYQRYAYNNFNYGFYDELYRNDPRYRQYQEQYRQYYAKHGYDEYERSSVHSGRSSANELSKECSSIQYPEQDIDSNESEFSSYHLQQGYSYNDVQNDVSTVEADQTSTPSSRLTPVKFSYAHPIARFCPGGLLLTAIPSHISTAVAMPIRIHNLQEIREGEESFQELKSHQGPLIRGLTHKNDVIEFCSQRIKAIKEKEDVVDRESYILLWELMILLLRQNGSVAGSDIAELLLRDHEVLRQTSLPLKPTLDTPVGEQQSIAEVNDSSSQSHAGDTSSPDEGIVVLHDKTILNTSRSIDVDKITRKFREFLLFGHKKDALEWAMKHGLWGHALFLASKMDLRTYANVMTRFANSLALNDPLQTLYQLMSGRQPLAVTNVADKKWGDWRPHLAMILSNPSMHPEVDSRSITTLGDTLASKGCLCAAHFCYIMAQVEFGTFEQKNSKLVLLTADHTLSFEEFSTNEAIQCTEIYEYAQSLANPGFMLTHLQFYKFLYAMRLVEHGFLEEALHYCEIIAGRLQEYPHLFQYEFISEVYKLSTQLKYHDPHFLRGQGEYEDQDDPDWLKNLSALVHNFNNVAPPADNYSNSYTDQQPPLDTNQNLNSNSQQFPSPPVENTFSQHSLNSNIQGDINNTQGPVNYYQANNWSHQNNNANSNISASSLADNSNYYNQNDGINSQGSFRRENSIPSHEENETTDVPSSPVTQTPPFDYFSGGTQQAQESKPLYDTSSSFNSTSLPRERRDSALSSGSRYSSSSMSAMNKSSKEVKKPDAKKDKATTQVGKTWLGGIFSRLLPKGPNQMILPDDKNPTIVWDDVKNCWVNKDSNDEDESSAPLAPPTDSELMGSKSSESTFHSPSNNTIPPMSSADSNMPVPPIPVSPPVNKFQRPKTRGMRQNYVDVLSTSGATKKTNPVPEGLFTPSYDNGASPNLFMPSPASVPSEHSSNLESSHATYTAPQLETEEHQPETQGTPLMFNPAEFDSRRSSVSNQRLTIGRMGRRAYPT